MKVKYFVELSVIFYGGVHCTGTLYLKLHYSLYC